MYFIYFLCIFQVFLLDCYHCFVLAGGWEYLNIYCRDNRNEPVDWWYIYKPPKQSDDFLATGINFTFITSEVNSRWAPSFQHVDKAMLLHTLAPLYSSDYSDYMAAVVYEGQAATNLFKGSAALGILMANELGGVWIGHTIPGFPDLKNGPSFPPAELKNGHLLTCLSLDLPTLNMIALAVKQTEPNIIKLSVPEKLKTHLPDWVKLLDPVPSEKVSSTSVKKTKILHFLTREKMLRGVMLARSPGDSRCLYKSFGKTNGVVMDAYGHTEHQNNVCDKKFGVRNINSISLKFTDHVYYINNETDSMGFAVSTAAEWQRTGRNKKQFWTCTGNVENQALTAKGGIIACVTNFQVWLAFDNLKVKEPECTQE